MDVCRFSASTNCKSSSSLSSSAECFAPWIVVYLNILSLSFHTQSPICFAFTCLYIFPHNQTYVWLYMIKNKQAHCVAVSSCLCSFPFLFAHRCGEREAVCLIYTSHCSCEAFYRSKYTDTHTYNGHHHTHTHPQFQWEHADRRLRKCFCTCVTLMMSKLPDFSAIA